MPEIWVCLGVVMWRARSLRLEGLVRTHSEWRGLWSSPSGRSGISMGRACGLARRQGCAGSMRQRQTGLRIGLGLGRVPYNLLQVLAAHPSQPIRHRALNPRTSRKKSRWGAGATPDADSDSEPDCLAKQATRVARATRARSVPGLRAGRTPGRCGGSGQGPVIAERAAVATRLVGAGLPPRTCLCTESCMAACTVWIADHGPDRKLCNPGGTGDSLECTTDGIDDTSINRLHTYGSHQESNLRSSRETYLDCTSS